MGGLQSGGGGSNGDAIPAQNRPKSLILWPIFGSGGQRKTTPRRALTTLWVTLGDCEVTLTGAVTTRCVRRPEMTSVEPPHDGPRVEGLHRERDGAPGATA